MWPGTANSGGWRSPQASAGTPNNTRELAQIDKKKPQLITVGASVLVEAAGIEPASVSDSHLGDYMLSRWFNLGLKARNDTLLKARPPQR